MGLILTAPSAWADPHAGEEPAVEEARPRPAIDARAKFLEFCQRIPSRKELENVRQGACLVLRTGRSPREEQLKNALRKPVPMNIQEDGGADEYLRKIRTMLVAEQAQSLADKMTAAIEHPLEDDSPRSIVPIIAALRTQFTTGYSKLHNDRSVCEAMARDLAPNYRADVRSLATWLATSPRQQDCTFRYRPEDIVAASKNQLNLEEAQALASYGVLHPIDDNTIESVLGDDLRNNLTPTQFFLLSNYTDNGQYYVINEVLRGESGEYSESDLRPLVKAMNGALARLPAARDVKVTRGIAINDPEKLQAFLSMHKPGAIVRYHAFTSTSIGNPYNGNIQFEIMSHSGARLGDFARYRTEKEVLFPAGSCFKVIGITVSKVQSFVVKLDQTKCP